MQQEQGTLQIEVGEKLKAVRQAAGLTLSEVQGRTGIDIAEISRAENGKLNLTLARIEQLAFAYGIKPVFTFSGKPKKLKLKKPAKV